MLPIHDCHDALIQALQTSSRVILQAPTGSGKSTQVPGILLDSGQIAPGKEIVVLQPRRLAARMLARRVAQERNGRLGDEVGYQVRLDRKTSAATRIRYITEGILLRQWLQEPRLDSVGCLIFDEFHERHLYSDLSLAHALHLQTSTRPDLKIVLMSATLDSTPLQHFLPDAAFVRSEGRSFPVDIRYLLKDPRSTHTPVWESAATAAQQLAERTEGDLLIFMPGRYEIDRTLETLKRSPLGKKYECLALHGELPAEQQDRVVTPGERRRVIVSTNIAETSLTLQGITGVIDSGLARIARYDAGKGINQLHVEPISQASADQRAGRAGRTAPGVCVRLWTEAGHRLRPSRETPEIHRVDLSEAVLTLAALEIEDWTSLALPDPPEPDRLQSSCEMLFRLGALSRTGGITPVGRELLEVPAHPRIGKLICEARKRGVAPEAAKLAAILQGRSLLVRSVSSAIQQQRTEFFSGDGSSDLLMQLQALEWAEAMRFESGKCRELGLHSQAARMASQTARLFDRTSSTMDLSRKEKEQAIRKCIALAFVDHLARRRPDTRRCDLLDGRVAEIDRDSICTDTHLLVATEIRDSERHTTPFLVGITRVEDAWMEELWPDLFSRKTHVVYDPHQKRVVCETLKTLGEIPLERNVSYEVADDDAARVLLEKIDAGDIPFPGWDEEVETWITRLNCLSTWRPDWEIPPITPEDRRTLLQHMLASCRTRKDVKQLKVLEHIQDWISPMHRDLLRSECPTRIQLPNGRRAQVRYEEGSPPVVSSKLQDFFGLNETPRIAGGEVICRVELLAPNRRPAALTDQLDRFWKEGYALVRKDLKGRYPKHDWPETPG